jgi:hypothetical protein
MNEIQELGVEQTTRGPSVLRQLRLRIFLSHSRVIELEGGKLRKAVG